ncbi:MAG: dnaX [Candidatus Saccharibacteria bacterium]|nr:dnaX [Candidatus Saccharibacteria bacterium]
MGQALYRKYRSKSLAEIVGQEHITTTLNQALKSGKISHAYLFTGPRGVGKTSIARILAHEINGIPYDDDSVHMDIIEIDAASNRRIDEIRELRDKVAVAPTSAKYKVYIIDEVHMLTKEAFNALLKTLEEPPAHVVFILATTDAHKLPETIVSRTQRFTFKPGAQQVVIDHLRMIAGKEDIKISDEALALLAQHGDGSFRDSVGLLDQLSNKSHSVETADVETMLGVPSDTAITDLLTAIAQGDSATSAQNLNALYEQGLQAAAIAKALAKQFRQQIITNTLSLAPELAFSLLTQLLDVPASHDPERLLEIQLLATTNSVVPLIAAQPAPVVATAPKAAGKTPAKPAPAEVEAAKPTKPEPKHVAVAPAAAVAAPVKAASAFDDTIWLQVLTALKQQYNTLYGVIRMAKPIFSGNELELAFNFAFHQKRINDPKNKKIVADIIEGLSGQKVVITCITQKDGEGPQVAAAAPTPAVAAHDVAAISNIFGGGEIL